MDRQVTWDPSTTRFEDQMEGSQVELDVFLFLFLFLENRRGQSFELYGNRHRRALSSAQIIS